MQHARLSATTYPYLRDLIQHDMARLAIKRPHVVKLLSSYTRMPEATVRNALSPGNPPPIDITGKQQYEYTLPGIVIQIGGMFAVQFETVMTKNKQKSVPELARAAAAAVLLMESKLLHGFVHWGWGLQNPGNGEPVSPRGYSDFAWDFEEEFYGRPLTATDLSLKPKYITLPGWP